MRRLLDTSVLIDHLRGVERAVELLTTFAAAGDELWSVTPVRTEVLAGMRRGEEKKTMLLLNALAWQVVTEEVADRAGVLARRFLRSHPGVDTVDYIIAAAALELGAQLVTLNLKHFPMFSDLRRPY
ncbi:MAG: type II toxin-antitoxin system VapC family toxin [Myxococcota bacterium]